MGLGLCSVWWTEISLYCKYVALLVCRMFCFCFFWYPLLSHTYYLFLELRNKGILETENLKQDLHLIKVTLQNLLITHCFSSPLSCSFLYDLRHSFFYLSSLVFHCTVHFITWIGNSLAVGLKTYHWFH
jgi:hypothetical protein